MIPFKEVKVLDINSEALGIPTLTLMENAGKALAEEILKLPVQGKVVLFLCGTGNNGGDGLVAARYCADQCDVKVLILGKEMKTGIARQNVERLPENVVLDHAIVGTDSWQEKVSGLVQNADYIVDSMLGVGITGKLREPYQYCVKEINNSGKPVISVDVPTGFGGELCVKPDVTVTFHDSKPGMTPQITDESGQIMKNGNCGTIIIRKIGIPLEAEKFVGVGDFVYYPLPGDQYHKGDNGNVLIIGGGPFTGAPALAASAALRTGSDLVFLAVPSRIYPIIASMSKDFIVNPIPSETHLTPEDVDHIVSMASRAHAVLIGPGLGKHDQTVTAVRELVEKFQHLPLIIDADAIYAVKDVEFHGNVIITPHRGEFTRVFQDSTLVVKGIPDSYFTNPMFSDLGESERERAQHTMEFARAHGVTVVQKGHLDLITDGERIKYNRTGNPGMTVGGTGDVLAGIIASLCARGLEPFNAGRLGTYIVGRAGDLAFREYWYSLTASDLPERIPKVLMEIFTG